MTAAPPQEQLLAHPQRSEMWLVSIPAGGFSLYAELWYDLTVIPSQHEYQRSAQISARRRLRQVKQQMAREVLPPEEEGGGGALQILKTQTSLFTSLSTLKKLYFLNLIKAELTLKL